MSSLSTKSLEEALQKKKYDAAFGIINKSVSFLELKLVINGNYPENFKEKTLKLFSEKPIRNKGEYENFAYNFSMIVSDLWKGVANEEDYAVKYLKKLHRKIFEAGERNFTTGFFCNFFDAFEKYHPQILGIPEDPKCFGIKREDVMRISRPQNHEYLMSRFISGSDGEEKDFSSSVPSLEPAR